MTQKCVWGKMKEQRKMSKSFRLGVAVTLVAALGMSACGGSDSSSGGSDNTDATEEPAGNLAETLGYTDNLLGDVSCDMGAVLALTGPGSFYGDTMTKGIDLAVKDIKAAGGPSFNFTTWDHKSGDPAAGVTAMKEMVAKGISIKLASYVDDLGAMLADTAKSKVFTLDGGGGTSIFGQGQPYFWGTRAITPNDTIDGVFKWWKEKNPEKLTVGVLGWDLGEALNKMIKDDFDMKVKRNGMTFNGIYELNAVGATDFSQSITKIKANQPDLLLVAVYGQDPGAFVNQASTAGITSFMMGSEFTPDGINASKGVYDSTGFTFAYDYFDAESPTLNPVAKLFVNGFKTAYDKLPDFYAANFYENTIRFWQLMRQASAAGIPNDKLCLGETLNTNLEANLDSLVSLYGGDAETNGVSALDPKTHSVLRRPMGVFNYVNGKVTPLAYFNIDGADYAAAD